MNVIMLRILNVVISYVMKLVFIVLHVIMLVVIMLYVILLYV
jgi:hypothetical protein